MLLALDTTTSVCSAALVRDGQLLAEVTTNIPRTHSQRLLPIIDTLFKEAGVTPGELERLAVTRGPGSFTGLRIGIATIKGMGLALGLPVVGLSSLLVLAHNFGGSGLICPVLNARREQVYTGLYRVGEGLEPNLVLPEQAIGISELMEKLSTFSEPIWFCGDAVDLVMPYALGEKEVQGLDSPRRAGLHHVGSRAAALADLAMAGGREFIDVDQLTPLYLRDSQAEVQLREREVGHGC